MNGVPAEQQVLAAVTAGLIAARIAMATPGMVVRIPGFAPSALSPPTGAALCGAPAVVPALPAHFLAVPPRSTVRRGGVARLAVMAPAADPVDIPANGRSELFSAPVAVLSVLVRLVVMAHEAGLACITAPGRPRLAGARFVRLEVLVRVLMMARS